MKTATKHANGNLTGKAQPVLDQQGKVIQQYGTVLRLPIALKEKTCLENVNALNQILVDTMTLRDLYKKSHWQVAGATFYQLHLLYDKHYDEQVKMVDEIAERIQLLGGISLAMAPDVAEKTRIPRPPRGREQAPAQISRLLQAHELLISKVREVAEQAQENGDAGTNDLLVSSVLRTNELQVWFLSEHLVDVSVVRAD